jgi:cytochrome c biogenesis protein CcmG/thiol:disulfide interchange protein DsbE
MTGLRRRALLTAPVVLAAAGGGLFWAASNRLRSPVPGPLPVPLLGQAVPAFDLPGLGGGPGFGSDDLARSGPVLLNLFASWCLPCAQETPELLKLKQQGVRIWGVAFRDEPAATVRFLKQNGEPYQRVALDRSGALEDVLRLIGVPETYLVDRKGTLCWGWAGELSAAVVRRSLAPALREA